jgi:hypothetical protein
MTYSSKKIDIKGIDGGMVQGDRSIDHIGGTRGEIREGWDKRDACYI